MNMRERARQRAAEYQAVDHQPNDLDVGHYLRLSDPDKYREILVRISQGRDDDGSAS